MKRILNKPEDYVNEMLLGLCAAHPEYYRASGPQGRVISRSRKSGKPKVGIVSGGGSGHLPIFTGYVGVGLLDACAIGDVFASPTVDQISYAIKEADYGMGVLNLYGNYGGDVMNFDMASEMLEMENIETETVLIADDVVSAPKSEREKRRGTGGLLYAFKAA
ncbi:MAG: dihydroxyacetone kinase subunit DhaK, partial [Bacteroidota bacterium]